MAVITILNNGVRKKKTSRAFNAKIMHELMRMYTLSFELVNTDSAVKYINPTAQFLADGQLFDITSYNMNSGKENITSVNAQHVGYRLNNYKLTATGYSYVGTLREIIEDILFLCVDENGKRASMEFNIGTVPDMGVISFSLNNKDVVTAKYAILALKNIGAESDFDNFTINFANKVGTGNKKTFKFGVDLNRFRRTWSKNNGATYDVDIADLQRLDGHENDRFDVGDTVSVQDDLIGDTITKRIITYTKCLDDPTKDKITLGVFISNIVTDVAMMSVDVDKSIKAGEQYNNCSISHADGFKCEADVGGKHIISKFNATTGPEITSDGEKMWGVAPDGKVMVKYIGNNEFSYAKIGNLMDTDTVGLSIYNNSKLFSSINALVDGGFAIGKGRDIRFYASKIGTRMYLNNVPRFCADSNFTDICDINGTSRFYANKKMTSLSDADGQDRFYAANNNITIIKDTYGYDRFYADNDITAISDAYGQDRFYVANNNTRIKDSYGYDVFYADNNMTKLKFNNVEVILDHNDAMLKFGNNAIGVDSKGVYKFKNGKGYYL